MLRGGVQSSHVRKMGLLQGSWRYIYTGVHCDGSIEDDYLCSGTMLGSGSSFKHASTLSRTIIIILSLLSQVLYSQLMMVNSPEAV